MKILLTQNVKKIGSKGDIVEVSSGYAQNFLIPQKKGIPADGGILSRAKQQAVHQAENTEKKKEAIQKLFQELEKKTITLQQKTNEKGGLYKALDENALSDFLGKETGADINAEMIQLDQPIKEVGEYNIKLQAFSVNGSVKVEVKGE